MKVCLVSPPTVTEFNERLVVESEAHRLIAQHAPLGILSLAAVLEKMGTAPYVLDLNWLYYNYSRSAVRLDRDGGFASYVVNFVRDMPFDVFGFGTICSTYPLTLRIAKGVRQMHPEATIMMGGPQASVVDVATLEHFPFVDLIVRGEAEETLPHLLDAISDREPSLICIQGITYRSGKSVIRNSNAPVIADLDALPLPAYHLFQQIADCRYLPLEAGRGCPFACSFCSTNDFFRRRYRMKSPGVLINQIRLLKRCYGVSYFELIHDMFTVDRNRVIDFCNAVENSGEKFWWGCSARTDTTDDELIGRMARAGCKALFFGIDTGSERVQKQINKCLSIPEALSRIRRASANRINTTVSLITGFPEEKEEDLRATVAFLGESLRHRNAEVQFHLLAPLAETPITTAYQDRLFYDDIISNISYQEWGQTSEERAMILAHKDIFTSFYAVPTPWLGRLRLRELGEFLLQGAKRHRYLMLLLHHLSGNLLDVFDRWGSWREGSKTYRNAASTIHQYYVGPGFSADLLKFARAYFRRNKIEYSHLTSTILDVEEALLTTDMLPNPVKYGRTANEVSNLRALSLDSVPVIAYNSGLLSVDANYERLVKCLARKGRLERLPADPHTLVLTREGDSCRIRQLSQPAHELLMLCDGSRSVREISTIFTRGTGLGSVSAAKAGAYGLALLFRQGLIGVKKRLAGSDIGPVSTRAKRKRGTQRRNRTTGDSNSELS